MFTQTLTRDLALHPHQFGLDLAEPESRGKTSYQHSRRSRQPGAASLARSVLLAALVALVALPSLANAAPGHKRPHPALGTTRAGSCVLPTFNPWLYVATCHAGTRAAANPVAATATTGAVSDTAGTAANTSTQPNGNVASGDCSNPDIYPVVYVEECQAGPAASSSTIAAASQSTGSTVSGGTSQPAATQPSSVQASGGGEAVSCTTDSNNPWLALEGGC
jgi:hypothetical protein